jgi:hypothetical protein
MRFTIRELLLVTTIVALAAGWWIDRAQFVRRAASAEAFNRGLVAVLDAFAPDWRDKLSPSGVIAVPEPHPVKAALRGQRWHFFFVSFKPSCLTLSPLL